MSTSQGRTSTGDAGAAFWRSLSQIWITFPPVYTGEACEDLQFPDPSGSRIKWNSKAQPERRGRFSDGGMDVCLYRICINAS